jgi:hypothetical protein
VIEDYAVVFFGSAWYKMLRLFFVAGFAVHLFACIFFQVKSNNDNVTAFYSAKNVVDDVSFLIFLVCSLLFLLKQYDVLGHWLQDLTNKYVSFQHYHEILALMGRQRHLNLFLSLLNGLNPFRVAAGLLLFCAYHIHYCRVW